MIIDPKKIFIKCVVYMHNCIVGIKLVKKNVRREPLAMHWEERCYRRYSKHSVAV